MEYRKIIRILGFGIIGISLNNCTPEEIILHGEISGTVTDALTNQPLQAATVKLIPSNVTTNTGNDGKYLFKSLAPGNYQIQVSKQNYAEGNNSASVTSANTTDIDFELDAIPEIHYSTTDSGLRIFFNIVVFCHFKDRSRGGCIYCHAKQGMDNCQSQVQGMSIPKQTVLK